MLATHIHTQPIDLWSQTSSLRRRIAGAERLFLFLDFDGTLAPIEREPSSARIPGALKSVLESLCARDDVFGVVISGRSLEDLVPRVGLPVVYAGNHGFEIRGGGLEYTVPVPPRSALQLVECCRELRVRLAPIAGAWIDFKQRTATVHLRQVARPHVPAVEFLTRTTLVEYPELEMCSGKEIFEIRPNIAWNKGCAVRWILHRMGGSEMDTICLGDDFTDEDMFRALLGGITIKIGPGNSSARYRLASAKILPFLSFVREAVGELRVRLGEQPLRRGSESRYRAAGRKDQPRLGTDCGDIALA